MTRFYNQIGRKIQLTMRIGRTITTMLSILSLRMLEMNVLFIFNMAQHLTLLGRTSKLFMRAKARKLLSRLSTWHTTAKEGEGEDISKHLTTLKKYWECLNLVKNSNLKISETQFKFAIVSSLPLSSDWQK